MRSWMLCLCLAVTACGSGRKDASEYDDAKNGLHVQAPGPDWIIKIASDCGPDRPACWVMTNTKSGAGIYLVNVTEFASPIGAKNPAGVIYEVSEMLQDERRDDPAKLTSVSAPVVSASGDIARIFWNVPGEDGRYMLHAAVVRLPSDPARLLTFVAGSEETHATATERDFIVFLESLSAVK